MNTIGSMIYQGGWGNIVIYIFSSVYRNVFEMNLKDREAILCVCVCESTTLQNSVVTQGLDQVGYVSPGCPQSQDSGALLSFSNSASFSWLNWEFEQTN